MRFKGKTAYIEDEAIGRMTFYRHIGRGDLAEDVEAARSLNKVLLIGGAVAFGLAIGGFYGGYVVWVVEWSDNVRANRSSDIVTPGGWTIMIASGCLGVAGMISALVGMVRGTDPVSLQEAKRLGHQYNQDLKKGHRGRPARRGGGDDDHGTQEEGPVGAVTAPPDSSPDWMLAPMITPDGQGFLTFAMRF